MKKAVFLDRDGIVNIDKNFIKSWDEFEFVPGIFENIRRLNQVGFLVIIVTNQSGIKRGFYTEETLKTIHRNMMQILEENNAYIDDIFYCPHFNDDNCNCRKPKPGMILEASKKHNIDLRESWIIGDNERDIIAGKKAGCKTIHVLTGVGQDKLSKCKTDADFTSENIYDAVEKVVLNTRQ
jgi:D-glycero-D-manno-heptose 1,7-bisphosphate phosphatase